MSFYTAPYKFSTGTSGLPGKSQLSLDAAHPYTAATVLRLDDTSSDGVDLTAVLLKITAPDDLVIQDQDNAAQFGRFTATGPAMDLGGAVEIPITWTANGDALTNNAAAVLGVMTSRSDVVPPSSPTWITLDEAKTHLRLALDDTVRDADVTQKLTSAEAAIVTDLSRTTAMVDTIAGWTPSTLPHDIRAAILLLLGESYVDRGDDPQGPPRWSTKLSQGDSSKFSPAIEGLLASWRPKVLA